ncbi:hypothetical protein [Pontibacter roseus]|uniref:hypothetical protein n=1 Tax=Pontibacter roseus TaxID=336989 RepID=UPI00035F1379|nr:hypothetical protein [Pontibacter roseus]
MQFNIDKFFDRIQEQGLSRQQVSLEVDREIKESESQKVVFLDQAFENPEYYKFICSQIDSYIVCLKALRNRIAPQEQESEEVALDNDNIVVYHTMRLLLLVQQYESKKRSAASNNL